MAQQAHVAIEHFDTQIVCASSGTRSLGLQQSTQWSSVKVWKKKKLAVDLVVVASAGVRQLVGSSKLGRIFFPVEIVLQSGSSVQFILRQKKLIFSTKKRRWASIQTHFERTEFNFAIGSSSFFRNLVEINFFFEILKGVDFSLNVVFDSSSCCCFFLLQL